MDRAQCCNFLTDSRETRELCFDIYQHGGHWKSGLIIEVVILRPKDDFMKNIHRESGRELNS
ncbi:hypothetical protein Ddye_026232 [Dipteronia dyeriana]|uniref:Uncharacterized protein n=1 Tax=Dipteronia dyeriana TaxID=168575 RepID=A0AAD9TLV6_9ROSI|nr:hypothetical protein Ddye_026232 [Dipteronia dyeriana]